jgi:hypothetical protein
MGFGYALTNVLNELVLAPATVGTGACARDDVVVRTNFSPIPHSQIFGDQSDGG